MGTLRGLLAAINDPANSQGLLNFGLNTLAQSGYSQTPRTFGEIVANSMLQSQQMAAKAAQEKMQQQMMQAQMEAMQRKDAPKLVSVLGPNGRPIYETADKAAGMEVPQEPRGSTADHAMIAEWKASGEPDYWKFLQRRAQILNPAPPPKPAGYSAPRDGINPTTGKPDTYTMDDAGNIRWLGIAPNTPAKLKSLPPAAINSLSEVGATAQDFSRLKSSFKEGFGGYGASMLGEIANTYQRNIGGDETGRAQWWQDYQTQKNVIRNRLFGSALTATEKAEFDKAMINPGMTDDTIKKNLARQEAIALRAARKLAEAYTKGQYDPDQVEGALGMSLKELESAPAVPAAGGGRTVKRTGTLNGRKVIEYSDGSVEYAQ